MTGEEKRQSEEKQPPVEAAAKEPEPQAEVPAPAHPKKAAQPEAEPAPPAPAPTQEPAPTAEAPAADEGPSLSDLGAAAEQASKVQPAEKAAPQPAPEPVPAAAPAAKAAPTPKEIVAEPDEPTYTNTIFAVKTSIGHERIVADAIENKALRKGSEVFAILCPQPMRGYIFIESRNPDALQELLKGVKKVRGIVRGEAGKIPMEEIEHFLAPKPLVSGIVEGNIVELIAGPFKGEKARVQQIDEAKEEITVELFEAMISIPITVRGDHVRVIEKEMK
jgi:transcriptional antiterminator NusG